MDAISVSKLNAYIKRIFDHEELLHNISVEGEVFGVSTSRNVIYFSLKDEEATLPCVCFYSTFLDEIKEGEKVVVVGSPNFYVKGGKLNFNVSRVEKFGKGKLYEDFLKLKEKLEREGLFDSTNKKSLPKEIKRIGVITSKEGAVLQDIKNVAWRRNPGIDIVLFDTKVQGKNAEQEIAHAINLLSEYDGIDVLVVARGGGSLEDLSAYNTEVVARATYECKKPIISAVGHETDFTIIDFVSDLRAPTPSAAAELLTYDLQDKKFEFKTLCDRFLKTGNSFLSNKTYNLSSLEYYLINSFNSYILTQKIRLSRTKERLLKTFEDKLNQNYYEIGLLENTIMKLNPFQILSRGYAKIEQNHKSIKSVKDVNNGEISIILKDGEIISNIVNIKEKNYEQ